MHLHMNLSLRTRDSIDSFLSNHLSGFFYMPYSIIPGPLFPVPRTKCHMLTWWHNHKRIRLLAVHPLRVWHYTWTQWDVPLTKTSALKSRLLSIKCFATFNSYCPKMQSATSNSKSGALPELFGKGDSDRTYPMTSDTPLDCKVLPVGMEHRGPPQSISIVMRILCEGGREYNAIFPQETWFCYIVSFTLES